MYRLLAGLLLLGVSVSVSASTYLTEQQAKAACDAALNSMNTFDCYEPRSCSLNSFNSLFTYSCETAMYNACGQSNVYGTLCEGGHNKPDKYSYYFGTCPPGTEANSDTGLCEEPPSEPCVWPEKEDIVNGGCYIPDNICPPGGSYTYNPNDDLSVCVGGDESCPVGWDTDPLTGVCTENDSSSSSSSSSSTSSSSSSSTSSSSTSSSSSSGGSSTSSSGGSSGSSSGGSSGSSSGGGSGGGGECTGDHCEEDGTVSGGGTCSERPVCEGDAELCEIITQVWLDRCGVSEDQKQAILDEFKTDGETLLDGSFEDLEDDINEFGTTGVTFADEPGALQAAVEAFFPAPSSCSSIPIAYGGWTASLDCEYFNKFKQMFGWFLTVVTAMYIWSIAVQPVDR